MKIETLKTTKMPWVEVARSLTPPAFWQFLYRRLVVKNVTDAELYQPMTGPAPYSPWLAPWFQSIFNSFNAFTVLSAQRSWTLWQGLSQALHVPGDVMEAGVFQGGSAKMLRILLERESSDKQLYLFDSFEGMKSVSNTNDRHDTGDFADTSLEGVQAVVGTRPFVHYRKGWVPETFAGLEDKRFCFAHIDLDLYEGVRDSLEFLYPRMSPGGIIVLDDYGFASCPGARKAVDDFFASRPEHPLALGTSQALIHKLP